MIWLAKMIFDGGTERSATEGDDRGKMWKGNEGVDSYKTTKA